MSIDPYSGRNPSYCFVELVSKEQADQAMLELSGKPILGRPVKLGPGVARSKGKHSQVESTGDVRNMRGRPTPVFDRWTRTDAVDHWKEYSEQGRRLFMGGLPPMSDHHAVNVGVRKLFTGYNV
jgi:RNA recognition motif-containing protein